jgi:hypothetical protein
LDLLLITPNKKYPPPVNAINNSNKMLFLALETKAEIKQIEIPKIQYAMPEVQLN